MEPEDYSTYSDKDLHDLLELHETTLKHYDMMLKKDLLSGDRFAVELSKKYLLDDMKAVEDEIQKRKNK